MISSLSGTLEARGADWAIINVGGVGFKVFMPTSSLSELGAVGSQAKLHTHLHLKEDDISLYGFGTPEELQIFNTLIGVSGLGPKMALAALSAMSVDQLTMAIASANTQLLVTIPGVGKKMAERMVLELKDKISAGWVSTSVLEAVQGNADVLAALSSLGYSVAEASRAVVSLPSDKLSLEEKIKLALQYLGGA